ncbi:MAG: hypothetical protein LBT04_09955 [Prevotellaceae bacterium]|jgi:hypothetical protein|nr:hypothetical protein [Prevotellaceae bacterium]
MRNTKRYKNSVEICRNCIGAGLLALHAEWDTFNREESDIVSCPVCEGTGKVLIKRQETIEIVPFSTKEFLKFEDFRKTTRTVVSQ